MARRVCTLRGMSLHASREELAPHLARLSIAIFAAVPFVMLPQAGDPLQAPRLAAVLLAAVIAGAAAGPPRVDRRTRGAALALGVLLAWALAAAVLGGPASGLFGVHGRLGGLVSLGASALAAVSGWWTLHRTSRFTASALAVVGAAQAVWVIFTFLRDGQAFGTGGNQVVTGGWLAVAFGVAAAAATARLWEGWARRAGATGALLMLVALGVLGSRGSWVGALAAGGVIAVAASGPRVRRAALIALVAVLIVAGAVLAGGESIAKLDPERLVQGSGAARWSIWAGTVELISEHPVAGVGPGRFLYEFPRYEPLEHARREPGVRADQAHSLPLHLAAESGVVAAVAWLALAVLAAAAARAGLRRRDGTTFILAAGFAAYLGQALFGVTAIELDALGWLLGGALLGRSASASRAQTPTEPVSGTSVRARALAAALPLAGAALLALTVWYLSADLLYGAGLRRFSAGEMAQAFTTHEAAIERCGLVDNYRVSLSDVALYGGPAERATALARVDEGLALEPASYDLAMARARLLESTAEEPGIVADAYLDALALYPWGPDVAREAARALLAAGRTDEAVPVAENLLRVLPDDEFAHEITRSAGQ